jgi:phosphoribosylformylglycinamidine synthase
MAQLTGCLEGMGDACRALDFPIVSGNVSLYNESKATGGGSAILPTPAIGGVGLLSDWRKSATIGFKGDNEAIWLIGHRASALGQTLWLREIAGRKDGAPPQVDLDKERRTGELIRKLIEGAHVTTVHDISDGGLAIALTEMALSSRLGIRIYQEDWRESPTSFLFSENQGCFVVAADKAIDIPAFADAAGIPALLIGDTDDEGEFFSFSSPDTLDNGKLIREGPSFWLELAALRAVHEGFFPKLMGADAALA